MIKIVQNSAYKWNEPSSVLVPLHSRGVDSNWMVKRAAAGCFTDFIRDLKPIKTATILHALAVGDDETWGENRNGDGFSRADNKTAHEWFKKIGHVFKNHKSNDPALACGEVIKTAHNDDMDRIELLLALDNNKCAKELEHFANGKDIVLSMGSAQDFDTCSYCRHNAKYAKDHCDHIKNHLREVAEDGQKIYMRNPNPKYFDISLITNTDGSPGRQADRIAFGLRKVASESEPTGLDLAAAYGLVEASNSKLAAMQRLASLYKTLPVTLRKSTVPEIVRADTIEELKKQAQVHGMDQLLGYLVKHAFILAPTDFVRVFLNTQCEQLNAVDSESLGLDDLVKSAEEVQSFNLPISQDDLGLTPATYRDLHRSCSMDANSAYERAIRNSMQTHIKVASVADDVRGLQDLYRHYKLSYAERNINYNLVASF